MPISLMLMLKPKVSSVMNASIIAIALNSFFAVCNVTFRPSLFHLVNLLLSVLRMASIFFSPCGFSADVACRRVLLNGLFLTSARAFVPAKTACSDEISFAVSDATERTTLFRLAIARDPDHKLSFPGSVAHRCRVQPLLSPVPENLTLRLEILHRSTILRRGTL